MARSKKKAEKKEDRARDELFEKLRGLAVKEVTVYYSGSGDSGYIDDVLFDGMNADNFNDEIEVEESSSKFDHESNMFVDITRKVMKKVGEAVKDWCGGSLEELYPGWEINDGSDGHFTFSVDEGKVKLVHNQNIVSQETEETEL